MTFLRLVVCLPAAKLGRINEAWRSIITTLTESPACGLSPQQVITAPGVKIPDYVEGPYWCFYARPWAVKFWDREWLINLILWFHYKKLRGEALEAFGTNLPGKTLQLSCAYGQLTPMMYQHIAASGGSMTVVDVVRAQLEKLAPKLPHPNNVTLMNGDATDLKLIPNASQDRVLMFFLPHELPREYRNKAFDEAFRVVKPGGQVLVVEFSKPKWWHPLRYIYLPFLKYLEPFAKDVWGTDNVTDWMNKKYADKIVSRKMIFGSYYQIILMKA